MQLWPDSYQERNALIPQLHEHDNIWELVAISTMRIYMDAKHVAIKIIESERWVRMRNTREVSIKRSHCCSNDENKL